MDAPEFLGTGWSFPPAFDNQGRSVRTASGEEDIRQSLRVLLTTHIGERVMHPTFGWRRDALMFEPMSTSFATVLKREIENAVLYFEPRIELNELRFNQLEVEQGLVEMRLEYTVRATNSRSNLVFPFYLEEGNNAGAQLP